MRRQARGSALTLAKLAYIGCGHDELVAPGSCIMEKHDVHCCCHASGVRSPHLLHCTHAHLQEDVLVIMSNTKRNIRQTHRPSPPPGAHYAHAAPSISEPAFNLRGTVRCAFTSCIVIPVTVLQAELPCMPIGMRDQHW